MMVQATLDDLRNPTHNTTPETHLVRIEDAGHLLQWIYDLVEFDSTRSASEKLTVKVRNLFSYSMLRKNKLLLRYNFSKVAGLFFILFFSFSFMKNFFGGANVTNPLSDF